MNKQKVNFDDFTDNYNKLLREGTNFFSDSEVYFSKYKIEILRSLVLGDGLDILEYGCGIGRNIPFIRENFPESTIVGSDISAASIEIAQDENLGIEFFIEPVNFNNKFDLIFIAGVFHHIPVEDRATIMKDLFTRLKVGGEIVIFEHNPFNPVTRKIVNDCPYDADAVLLKPKELKSLLEDARFLVNRKGYCLFVPPSLSFFSSFENKLSWLPLGGQYWVKATR